MTGSTGSLLNLNPTLLESFPIGKSTRVSREHTVFWNQSLPAETRNQEHGISAWAHPFRKPPTVRDSHPPI